MRSARPKPLHQICGRPMVMHVIHALADVDVDRTVVVVGHGAERVTKKVQEQAPGWAHVTFVEQTVQRGTGDAAMVGMTAIPGDDLDDTRRSSCFLATLRCCAPRRCSCWWPRTSAVETRPLPSPRSSKIPPDTGGCCGHRRSRATGGCCRSSSSATPASRRWRSARCGRACARSDATCSARHCAGCSPDNSQGEYYLTDVVEVLAGMGHQIGTVQAPEEETRGVNDRWQLALAERELRSRTNRHWLLNGVTMLDPAKPSSTSRCSSAAT